MADYHFANRDDLIQLLEEEMNLNGRYQARIEELERAGRELMLAAEGTDMEYAVALKLQRLGEVLKRKP
jgi:hypothetical protein